MPENTKTIDWHKIFLDASLYAIRSMGMEEFKKCSFFGSNYAPEVDTNRGS